MCHAAITELLKGDLSPFHCPQGPEKQQEGEEEVVCEWRTAFWLSGIFYTCIYIFLLTICMYNHNYLYVYHSVRLNLKSDSFSPCSVAVGACSASVRQQAEGSGCGLAETAARSDTKVLALPPLLCLRHTEHAQEDGGSSRDAA